jgi:hypothetical protein
MRGLKYQGSWLQRALSHPLTAPFLIMINVVTAIVDYEKGPLIIALFYTLLLLWMLNSYWRAWKEGADTSRITAIGLGIFGLSGLLRLVVKPSR